MTEIQWTDLTRNPIKEASGGNYCIPISSGCKNCYASALNSKGTRFGGNGRRFGIRPEGHPEMSLNTEMLLDWTRMRKSKKIFVGSMTDIFGEWVPDWMIFALFLAMAQSPFQTFQILTKRPERAAEVIGSWLRHFGSGQLPANIWLGTSAEDQATYDDRIKWLNRCLAQVRFLSLEPLLGPINLGDIEGVDWIIVGGESGPKARPLNLAWIYDILAQCDVIPLYRAKIPVFVKQLGSHWAKRIGVTHSKGGDPDEWPKALRVRMFPYTSLRHCSTPAKLRSIQDQEENRMIKSISEIPQQPMDAWQVAGHLFGQEAVDQDHLLAGEAARQMRAANWTFVEYDPETGEEIMEPPSYETTRTNRT